jgi:hypothetical protein
MADIWIEIDERIKAGQPITQLLKRITYQVKLNRKWPRVDCLMMVPGLAVSERARTTIESLGLMGLQFLGFKVNGEPFFMFYTQRSIDCLDTARSEITYFRSAPKTVKNVVRFAFIEERLQACDLFTIPELSDGMFSWTQHIFVTDEARHIIENAGLDGFQYETLAPPNQ